MLVLVLLALTPRLVLVLVLVPVLQLPRLYLLPHLR